MNQQIDKSIDESSDIRFQCTSAPAQGSRCVGVEAPQLMFSAPGACTLAGGWGGGADSFSARGVWKLGVAARKVSFSFGGPRQNSANGKRQCGQPTRDNTNFPILPIPKKASSKLIWGLEARKFIFPSRGQWKNNIEGAPNVQAPAWKLVLSRVVGFLTPFFLGWRHHFFDVFNVLLIYWFIDLSICWFTSWSVLNYGIIFLIIFQVSSLREPFLERVLVANTTRTRFKRVLVAIIPCFVG